MCVLPLVEREFRAATRRPVLYWARVVVAAAAVMLGGFLLKGLQNWQGGTVVGQRLFHLLSEVAFVLSLSAGVFTTAGVICDEKRWGTLELLILTDLRPLSVVLGKLAASSLNALQTLLGIVPVLALCLILGGVSWQEFWRMIAVLATTLWFSLSAGILVSTVSWHSSRARVGTIALVCIVAGILAAADHVLVGEMSRWGVGSILPGLFQAYSQVVDEQYALPPGNFWASLGFMNVLALCLLWLAGRWLPRGVIRKPKELAANGLRERLVRWVTGEAQSDASFRRHWLNRNPIFWLASRRRWHWVRLWLWLLAVIAAWLAAAWWVGFANGQIDYLVLLVLPLGMHVVVKIAVGAEASRRLNELRRTGELELLLITPISPRRISRGLILAMKRQFKAPMLLILAIDAVLLLFGAGWCRDPDPLLVQRLCALIGKAPTHLVLRDHGEATRTLILWAVMAPLILDLRALAWNGLWLGLRSSTVTNALRRTLSRVLIEPTFWFLVTLPIAPSLWYFGPILPAPVGWVLGGVIWWMVIGLGSSAALTALARRKLDGRFRKTATMRFGI